MTIRERAQAILERHGATLACQADFLTYTDAQAILDALDAAETRDVHIVGTNTYQRVRLVPDPAERAEGVTR